MIRQADLHYRLLSRLPDAAFALLADKLEALEFSVGDCFANSDDPIAFAHFLEEGLASVVAISLKGQKAEAGIIGREGFVHPARSSGATAFRV